MITFKQFLNEGHRSGELYHFLNNRENKRNIIFSDIMEPVWRHMFTNAHGVKEGRVDGISMTRNPKIIMKKEDDTILLVFEASKLSSNNKIIPVDADRTAYRDLNLRTRSRKKQAEVDWQEEFVVGKIKNISKKLKRIEIYNKNLTPHFIEWQEYAKKHNIQFKVHS